MAKILEMPHQATISGFKGTLDFYYHDKQPCVRSWPRSPGHKRSSAVEAQWPAFSWAAANWNNLSPEVRDAYNRLASGTTASGRDMFTKSFIKAIYVELE